MWKALLELVLNYAARRTVDKIAEDSEVAPDLKGMAQEASAQVAGVLAEEIETKTGVK